jgi:hypothetical protein
LPPIAPTTISVSATDIATQIDSIDAIRARPSHNAEASQTFSMASSFRPSAGRRIPAQPR